MIAHANKLYYYKYNKSLREIIVNRSDFNSQAAIALSPMLLKEKITSDWISANINEENF